MASFWDEIQKQYANAEDRVNRAKDAGINMLARKGDMINQGFNNALAVLTGQGNMLGQVAGLQDSMLGRAIQQDQFGKTFGLDEERFRFDKASQTESNKIANKNASANMLSAQSGANFTTAQIEQMRSEREKNEKLAKETNALGAVEARYFIAQFPEARSYYSELIAAGVSPGKAMEAVRQKGVNEGYGKNSKGNGFQFYSNDTYNVGPVKEQAYGGKTKKVSFRVEG